MAVPGRRSKPASTFAWHLPLAVLLSVSAVRATETEEPADAGSATRNGAGSTKDMLATGQHPHLHGGVSVEVEPDPLKQQMDKLIATARERNEKLRGLDEKVKTKKSVASKAWQLTRDTMNYVFETRGYGPSSEAGDVILDEKSRVTSRAAAQYLRQREEDELQLQIVSQVVQLASALGTADREVGDSEAIEAYSNLENLVGPDEAQQTLSVLSDYAKQVNVPDSLYGKPLWSVSDRNKKLHRIMEKCLDTDPSIQAIKTAVHKYNTHGKLFLATSRVVKTSLNLASMTPTLAAPVSQVGLYFFTMATGGAEEDKLLRELYLDQRLDSRSKVVSETAHMALENYQLARLTKNPILLGCTESIITQMTGPEAVGEVLGTSVLPRLARKPDHPPDGAKPVELKGSAGSLAGSQAAVPQ